MRLSGRDAFGRENEIAIVKIPRVLPRVIRLPDKLAGGGQLFVSISSVMRASAHSFVSRATRIWRSTRTT